MGTDTPKHTKPAVMNGRVVVPTAASRLMASSIGEYPFFAAPHAAQAVTKAAGPITPPQAGARRSLTGHGLAEPSELAVGASGSVPDG